MTTYGMINPEITDSYRRTLIFNNSLLTREYDERYDFRISEQIRKMRTSSLMSRPATDEEVEKYVSREKSLQDKRRARYTARLEANVEPSVRRYAENMGAFLQIP